MLQSIQSIFKKPSTSFQTLSYLHLEVNKQYSSFELPVSSTHLILAGDIGRLQDYDEYLSFLQKQTKKFDLVFLVLVNHEFYNTSFEAGLEKARYLEQEPCLNGRLVLLHQRRYDIPGTRISILGCTLWSRAPAEAREKVRAKTKDFTNIQHWTIDQHNAAHESDLAWLRDQVEAIHQANETLCHKKDARSIVVVTHHAPSPAHFESPACADSLEYCLWDGSVVGEVGWGKAVGVWPYALYYGVQGEGY